MSGVLRQYVENALMSKTKTTTSEKYTRCVFAAAVAVAAALSRLLRRPARVRACATFLPCL
jgi:hypothetical protein